VRQTSDLIMRICILTLCLLGSATAEPFPPELALAFEPLAEFSDQFGGYRSPLKFHDQREVKTAEQWIERRKEILAKWHELMGKWPPLIDAPKFEIQEEEKREGMMQKRILVEIAPGQMAEVYLLLPDEISEPRPAVIVPFYGAETGAGLDERELLDFGYELTKRGFVTLSMGGVSPRRVGASEEEARIQPLSFMAYATANIHRALANLPEVDGERIGIVGHSFGGKWAMFSSCLYEKFACAVWSDGGIVFDEDRGNVNYWEPWYLGYDPETKRAPGIPSAKNPRTGAYAKMIEGGFDLHELHALMAPRPFLVSGGSEDFPARWTALNHAVAVNRLLAVENRVAMTNRPDHTPTSESNEQLFEFFEHFLEP
jgi:dienelactone hydrolase